MQAKIVVVRSVAWLSTVVAAISHVSALSKIKISTFNFDDLTGGYQPIVNG